MQKRWQKDWADDVLFIFEEMGPSRGKENCTPISYFHSIKMPCRLIPIKCSKCVVDCMNVLWLIRITLVRRNGCDFFISLLKKRYIQIEA